MKIFLGLLAGLVISELALRVFSPTPNTAKYYPCTPYLTQFFNPNPSFMPGASDQTTFFAYSLSIRGGEFSANHTYRILAVGGSTTESSYLDDSKTWPYDLLQKLNQSSNQRVWVGNAA